MSADTRASELVQAHPCPQSVGRHEWIWFMACLCQENGVSASDAEDAVREALTRDETPNEVSAAVTSAYARSGDSAKQAVFVDGKRLSTKPKFSLTALQEAVSGVPTSVSRSWLLERSPAWAFDAVSFLSLLYSPSEAVLVFTDMQSRIPAVKLQNGKAYEWKRKSWVEVELESVRQGLEDTRFEDGVWFLNQPVTGEWYGDPGSKQTCRSQQNVTAFRWLVLESDQAPEAEWLRFLTTVPGVGAIYTSGGKSVHALVRLDAGSKMEFDTMVLRHKHRLVTLGADPAAMTAVRLTRLPWCWRGSKRQELLYLNPAATAGGKAIWKA